MATTITTFFLATFLAITMPLTTAQKATAPAPSAAAMAPNLTAVLVKGGQYTTFLRLLEETQVATQIDSQINNTYFSPNGNNGLTVFAPTDNAFSSLKSGTINSLTQQDQVNLVLYHVLPNYYSEDTFQTASNPVRTQASGSTGVYTVNVTSSQNQVNVSTGLDSTTIDNVLLKGPPLAVYSIDKVLLPNDLFGVKPPAASPPAPANGSASGLDNPVGSTVGSKSSGAVYGKSSVLWSVIAGVGLVGVVFGGLL